jgi:hydroxymethylpyrimidine pyrophosphatase-like HAD family hydrolase
MILSIYKRPIVCLQEHVVPYEDAVEIINYIRDKSLWATIETDVGRHVIEMHGEITYTKEECQAFADKAIEFIKSAKTIYKFGIFPPITSNYRDEEIHKALPKYEWSFRLTGYELIHKNCGKGKLLQQFAKLTGYDENKLIMFGDNENDSQAFRLCKNKVAMAHSSEELKDLATYVAKSDLGIAEYINKLFLGK